MIQLQNATKIYSQGELDVRALNWVNLAINEGGLNLPTGDGTAT